MRRLVLALALLCLPAFGATIKLYMKDGDVQRVREYQVTGDRVRFLSVERGEWEEVPKDLVDLARTEKEAKRAEDARKMEAQQTDAEEQAERAQRREIEAIPQDAGVYTLPGEQAVSLKQGDIKAINSKGRSILKVVTPIPIVAGKTVVEVEGKESPNKLNGQRPEFYLRQPYDLEQFALVRLKPSKTGRIVDTWSIVPVTKEIVQNLDKVEVFKRQLGESLFKVWPQKPMDPGPYALVYYTDGSGKLVVYDFDLK